jgi:hypothetical protein
METEILLLILAVNLAILTAELWFRRRIPEFSERTVLPLAAAVMAAVTAYLITKSPESGIWFAAVALIFAVTRKSTGAFSFAALAGALVSGMLLGMILFRPHSAAVFYPAVIMTLMGSAAPFFSGVFRDGELRSAAASRFYFAALAGILIFFGFWLATMWLFISGWQAVGAAVLAGTIIAPAMGVLRRFPANSELFPVRAIGAGLFIAYLIAGAYGLVVASLVLLAIQSTEGRGKGFAEIRPAGFAVLLSVGLMFAAYAMGVGRSFYLYDRQGPLILFLAVSLAIGALSLRKLR